MSATNNDGGSAFPVHPVAMSDGKGMSLRDWFAGQALAGIATLSANAKYLEKVVGIAEKHKITPDDVFAAVAFNMADAMLKAREAK